MPKLSCFKKLYTICGLIFTLAHSQLTLASLQVFPTRLHLTQQQRITQISLRHLGDKPERYKIQVVFFRMKSDGSLQEVPTPVEGDRSLGPSIRFSPREVQLNPRQEQTVRVMFVPSQSITDGEYRTHIRFEPVSDPEPVAQKTNGREVAMQLTAKVAVAVPVFYRQGNLELKVELSNLKYFKTTDQKPAVSLDLNAKGNRFVYADFHTYHVAPNGTKTEIGLVKGFSSYIERRPATLFLEPEKAKNLTSGKIRVELVAQENDGGEQLAAVEKAL